MVYTPEERKQRARASRKKWNEKNPEKVKQYKRDGNARSERNRRMNRRMDLPFCGVDGEGGNLADPGALFGERHEYLLLRAGEFVLETGRPLQWDECFEFLCDLPKDREYVSYFFDYDATMMLRTVPRDERIRRLLNPGLRTRNFRRLPVDIDGYQVDYTPHKEFRVKRKTDKAWTVVSDVGTFFQSAFVKTLKAWEIGTPEQLTMIEAGKAQRADFGALTAETEKYNALECDLLEQLMTQFRQTCRDVGYMPDKWQGPGRMAMAILKAHHVTANYDTGAVMRNAELRLVANAAYYGGRFETTAAGPINTPVYQYDINSAYPDAIRRLPCLKHGRWTKTTERPAAGTIWCADVSFDHPFEGLLYHLPIRTDKGALMYPQKGRGTYWSVEIEAAEKYGADITPQGEFYVHHADCACEPFEFVPELYAERKKLGKSAKGKVLKLGMNSIYGKLAQSVGQAQFANPVWAGLITAMTRAKLIEAYSEAPYQCYMLATDAVFMGEPIDLPTGAALGEWELTTHSDGMFIIMPGLYFGSHADNLHKTRGVPLKAVKDLRSEFESNFERMIKTGYTSAGDVVVPMTDFISLKVAMHRKGDLAGQWVKTKRSISFDWVNKRIPGKTFKDGRGVWRTSPYAGGPELVSVPYDRLIGGSAEIRAAKYVQEDAPDWADWFQASILVEGGLNVEGVE